MERLPQGISSRKGKNRTLILAGVCSRCLPPAVPDSNVVSASGGCKPKTPKIPPPLQINCIHLPVRTTSQWGVSCSGTCSARERGYVDAMVNNLLDLQRVEFTDVNRCCNFRGYGQFSIDLDASRGSYSCRGGIFAVLGLHPHNPSDGCQTPYPMRKQRTFTAVGRSKKVMGVSRPEMTAPTSQRDCGRSEGRKHAINQTIDPSRAFQATRPRRDESVGLISM